jgi:hypothetical protein
MKDSQTVEYRTETIKISENCTVNIRRPILSESARVKAENNVVLALERYGKVMNSI